MNHNTLQKVKWQIAGFAAFFASNRDLKNYMMPSHETLRVICPWCPDEKTYERVTDLRSHMKGAHPHQLAKYPADLISENNAI